MGRYVALLRGINVRGNRLQDVVAQAPRGFGAQPARYRYDVIFLKAPLSASVAIKDFPTKEGVDEARAGRGVLYVSRLISKASQSRISKLVTLPIYPSATRGGDGDAARSRLRPM